MKTRSLSLLLAAIVILVVNGCNPKAPAEQTEDNGMITSEFFGLMPDGDSTFLYTFTSESGIIMKATSYADHNEIHTPDKDGKMGNVVLVSITWSNTLPDIPISEHSLEDLETG